jgi:protein-tyrosine-phosphatase
MAEKLLQHALAAESPPLRDIPVVSAGLAAYPGEPATRHSAQILKRIGLSLDSHRSQRVTPELLENARLVLCMTESHRYSLLSLYDGIQAPIHLFREFMQDDHAAEEITDPYGGDLHTYEECRDDIMEAIPSIIRYLQQHSQT